MRFSPPATSPPGPTPRYQDASRRCYSLISLLAAIITALFPATVVAEYYLDFGQTVWNDVLQNWKAPGNIPVVYPNATSTDAEISGPNTVHVAVPRTMGSLTLLNGTTLTGDLLVVLQGGRISNGSSDRSPTLQSTINNSIALFPDAGALTIEGNLVFNNGINATGAPVIFRKCDVDLGPAVQILASMIQVGDANPYARLDLLEGAFARPSGDMTVGTSPGKLGVVMTTNSTLEIGGNLKFGHGGDCLVVIGGGSTSVAGYMSFADFSAANPLPTTTVTFSNTTVSVADNGGPGMRGQYFFGQGGQNKPAAIQLPATRLVVRGGGFLTVDQRIDLGVDNTIVDTNGGGAHITSILWGKALIKEGAGVLKLSRTNFYGGRGSGPGALDGTIVRGGFIEFFESANLNDGGYTNGGAIQPTGLKNIQLNGGGLRWATGSSADISSRFRVLNNFSFDTNGNNVAFGTSLTGTGGMTKLGAGTLTLAASNTYAGGTTVRAGAVQFTSLATLGTGNVTLDGGSLRWATGNTVDVSPRLQPLGLGGATFDTNGNNVTFAGGQVSGPGDFIKVGGGTLTLTGTHPWTGSLVVNGGALVLNGTATGKSFTHIGDSASGTLTVQNGGTLATAAQARLGVTAGVTGTATVGALSTLSAGTFLEVGSGGTGTLNVQDGGLVSAGTTMALGVLPGSNGTLNVNGTGGGQSARLSAGTTIFVGYQGTGLLDIGSGGQVTLGGQLRLGDASGSSGVVGLNTGGALNVGGADGIFAGAGSYGFYLSGGTLKVIQSSLTTTVRMTLTNLSLIDTSGVNAVLSGTLSGTGGIAKIGGGTLYLNVPNSYAGGTALYGGQIVVSAANAFGNGPISVYSGNVHSSSTFSRDVPVIVDGATASLTAGSFVEIGVGGAGSLTVTNGAQVSTPSSLAFAILPGGTSGNASVTGAGSSLSVGSTLFLGFNGNGALAVGAGGSVTSGPIELGSNATGAGFFTLSPGGTLNIGGTNGIIKGSGTAVFNLAGGLLKITGSDLTSSVPMTLSNVTLVDTSGVTCTLSGALSGGGGIAKTGGGTLTLSGPNSYTGNTQIIAGTLTVSTPVLADNADIALSTGATLNLPYVGTDSVNHLSIDGVLKTSGTWGSLASSATNKTALITGTGILNVITNGAPVIVITNPASTTGTVGEALSRTFTQSGAFGALTWSLNSGTLPTGLTFSDAGVLSGTPTQAGSFSITVRVTDPNGFFAVSSTYTLVLSHPIVTVNNPAIAAGRTNVPFSQTFTQSGGNGAATFAIASGTLPSGLTLASNGVLSGTPSQAGSFAITVAATDIYGAVGTGAAYALTIVQASSNANLTSITPSAGNLTPAFASATISYSAYVGPGIASVTLTPVAVDALVGITINGASVVSGSTSPALPLTNGANAISIVVTSSDYTVQKIYTLTLTRTSGLILTGGGLTLQEEGGTFAQGNIAASGTAFAKDVLPGYAAHTIAHLNDTTFGNANSWIANSANSFAGISLGGTLVRVNQLAFGRDNDGIFPDRCLTRYTLQFTTEPNPTAATSAWTTIGTLDYLSAGGTNFDAPGLRHRYTFTPVTATGLRLITVDASTAIDEMEVYEQSGLILTGGGLALISEGGSMSSANIALHPSATAFADGVIAGFPAHTIAHLNDGLYGNNYSWLNDIPAPFAGIALGSSLTVNSIAFGRDNTGGFADRALGLFTLQYTNVPNPSASTPAGSWTTIGTLDYQFAGVYQFTTPARRHAYSFTPVTATALRLVGSTGNNGFDEIEIYSASSPLNTWRQRYLGSVDNTGPAADTADPNGNGIPNLLEYALNGNPLGSLPSSSILPLASRSADHRLQLTFTRYLDRSDITLTFQASDDLLTWTDLAQSVNGTAFVSLQAGVSIAETGTGNLRTVSMADLYTVTDPAHPKRFLRLSATR